MQASFGNVSGVGMRSPISTNFPQAYLHELVPAGGDNDGVLGVGAEANARNPVGVALVGDGVLAVTKGVPQLDAAVTRAGDDLTVVGGEGNGKDIVVVANKGTGSASAGELPETERLIPRGGESVGTVRGDNLCSTQQKAASQPNLYVYISLYIYLFCELNSEFLQLSVVLHTQSETMWEWPCRLRLG